MAQRSRKGKHFLAVYRNVAPEKSRCSICGDLSIVRNGMTTCCQAPVSGIPTKYERETQAAYNRKRPPRPDQARILEEQDNRCFYCRVKFGSVRKRNNRPVTIRIEWDHMLPFVYSQNNRTDNFVAACQVSSDNVEIVRRSVPIVKAIFSSAGEKCVRRCETRAAGMYGSIVIAAADVGGPFGIICKGRRGQTRASV
jgi:hypothetical protein